MCPPNSILTGCDFAVLKGLRSLDTFFKFQVQLCTDTIDVNSMTCINVHEENVVFTCDLSSKLKELMINMYSNKCMNFD